MRQVDDGRCLRCRGGFCVVFRRRAHGRTDAGGRGAAPPRGCRGAEAPTCRRGGKGGCNGGPPPCQVRGSAARRGLTTPNLAFLPFSRSSPSALTWVFRTGASTNAPALSAAVDSRPAIPRLPFHRIARLIV